MPAPVKTDSPTQAPSTNPGLDPERFYNPERLCPSQRGDSEKFSRP